MLTLGNIADAIMLTAEACGGQLTRDAAKMMAVDLKTYGPDAVMAALTRCRREVKGRLGLKDIIERISDGRPGADEAWALALDAQDEQKTVVWCVEMREAFAVAKPLLDIGDKVAARMAFKEAFERMVSDARASRQPAHWEVSAGWDAELRIAAITKAVDTGLLTQDGAARFLPAPPAPAGTPVALLTGPAPDDEVAHANIAKLKGIIADAQASREALREERARKQREETETMRKAVLDKVAAKLAGDE